MILEAELAGLPWGMKHLIMNTLRNEKCTSDHVLVLADAVDECMDQLPDVSFYMEACKNAVTRLREEAPRYTQITINQGE